MLLACACRIRVVRREPEDADERMAIRPFLRNRSAIVLSRNVFPGSPGAPIKNNTDCAPLMSSFAVATDFLVQNVIDNSFKHPFLSYLHSDVRLMMPLLTSTIPIVVHLIVKCEVSDGRIGINEMLRVRNWQGVFHKIASFARQSFRIR